MSKCSYQYKGKTYSEDRLRRLLINELPSRSQQESISFLKNYLGMPEDQITVVMGLIENKSLGRFKADASIILSDKATIGVAYHEAFHRVWRTVLSNEERLTAINEVKRRSNIKNIIAGYKSIYPKLSENELIEEFLADEFSDYTLNKNFKAEVPIKSIFQKLWAFLKKMLGLKPTTVQIIYDKILNKQYKNAPKSAQQYLKDADKIVVQGHEFTIEEKNELTAVLTQRFVKGMLQINGDIEAFTNNNSSTKIREFLDQVIMLPLIDDLEAKGEPDSLIDAVYADIEQVTQDLTAPLSKSVFINGVVKQLKLIGLTISDNIEDDTDGALDEDTKAPREFTPSIQIDPKSKMGAKVKLLLSSLTNTSSSTPRFGFDKPVSWTEAFIQIGYRMAGVPSSHFREELKKLNLSYIPELTTLLSKDFNFEQDFITTMAMTVNRFYKMSHKDGEIYFYDAASGTKREKILNEWKNNLSKQINDWEEWKAATDVMNANHTNKSDDEIAEHFGFELNPSIPDVRNELLLILDHAANYKGDKPELKNIFKDLNIDGYTKSLADKQTIFEDTVDLMVTMGSDKLYILGLNTQQTRIIDGIRFAQTKFIPRPTSKELEGLTAEEIQIAKKTVEAKNIDILRPFAPMQVSEFNVTKQEDGTYIIHNKWLQKILNGESLDLIIPYMVDNQNKDELEISKLNEADLFSMHLNGALQGMNISMKHADRGTFFAYNFGNNNPLYGKDTNVPTTLSILEQNIIEQINLERKFTNFMRSNKLPVQYIGKTKENSKDSDEGAFFKDVIGDNWDEFLETGVLDELKVKKFVAARFNEYKKDIEDNGLLEDYDFPIYSEKETKRVSKLKGINNQLLFEYGNVELLLASAFVNEVSSHIFETRFFSGDVKAFKNGTDLFKRLSPQSSNGKVSVNDTVTQQEVSKQLDQEFEVLNPVTGEIVLVNPAIGFKGTEQFFRSVTGAEREDYRSSLLEPALTVSGKPVISKLTGKPESKLFMLFEFGFIQDFPGKTIEELQKLYEPKFRLYEKKYAGINENDGLSYMTLPAFKNFMLRQGGWSKGMEVVYQTEMKIANMTNLDQIANVEITIDGATFKPFEINSAEIKDKDGNVIREADGWKERVVDGKVVKTESVHTIKTQYGGYSTPEEYYHQMKGELQYQFLMVLKDSKHLLIPSSIMGTNLQLMNFSMLANGVDLYHMGSANKVGGVDARLAAKNVLGNEKDVRKDRKHINDLAERGLDFYGKDGYFNHDALTENLDILSYLSDWADLKDQVKIGNKVKSEIKGSTQSLKIMLSNLVTNGTERFEGAKQIIDNYKEIVRKMVKNNHDNLLDKIGFNVDTREFDSLDQLKKTMLESSQMQDAPDNIRNAVENFFDDTTIGLEPIPMKNKIENVLYALITSGIISFDRPGSSYPQAAVTGYEKLGSRTFDENGLQNGSDALKFYEPVFDEEGNVTKINPAEIIMPLPDQWIKPLLKWAGTNNLVKAIEKLNKYIETKPELFQVKGLRIPNQQLSSNDMFQIKKFHLPTMQNYVLVPSEIVIKVGSDFDIDKLNIYWGDIIQIVFGGKSKEHLLDQALLEKEKEILLHPRNAHHLLMPLTDEIFVKDVYDFLVKEGLITPPAKSSVASILPSTNVRNTVVFVKGKDGVGPVALGITNSATNQADTLSINEFYKNQDGDTRPTKLLFHHMGEVYTMDNYTDNKGTVISEILSQLLTTQVDNVKNPTAVLMNINMQSLGVVLYLIRRKINPKSIALLLQQPIIAKYLQYQRQNESLLNKQVTLFDKQSGEMSNNQLEKKLLADLGYKIGMPKDVFLTDFVITDAQMLQNAKSKKFDEAQLNYLAYFKALVEQARTFNDFQATQNSDTKGLKDRQAWDEAQQIRERVRLAQIVTITNVKRLDTTGVISPFYQYGRQTYNIYRSFYTLLNSTFGGLLLDFKNAAADNAKGATKDRVRQTIENDFMLFLVHTFGTNKEEFDRLMKGNSVAKRVIELKTKLPSNLVLKAFFPVLSNTTDISKEDSPEKIDNLRLFEKELNSLDSNDLRLSMEEIHEIDPELYNDLVKVLFFQTGLNVSPFNYRAVVPVGLNSQRTEFNNFEFLYQDLLLNSLKELKAFSLNADQADKIFKRFKGLFAANNPQFLNKNTEYLWKNGLYPYPIAKIRDKDTGKTRLTTKNNKQEQQQLGNAYMKQYFKELLNEDLYSDKVRDELRPKTSSKQSEDDYLFMPEASIDPAMVENFDDFQVIWTSDDLPGSMDEFFPMELGSKTEIPTGNVSNSIKSESFEKELGLRNSDGTRKKMKESDYETALRKVKRLNSKYQSMFELIKTTGEKGDGRVYYSIKLSNYGATLVTMGYQPDLSIRDKYFENGSKTDAKTILEKISKSDSNLATVAKQLLKYADINNVVVNLVDKIGEPVFDNEKVSLTRGIYYSKNSSKNPNSISIAEFVNQPSGRSEGVILHEILHALTLEELFYKNKDAAKDFEKLFNYVKANSPKGMYALTNLDEFMTGIFTDARFIQHLKTLPPIKSVKEYKNLFEEILDLFRKLFKLEDSSALTQALSIASHVLSDIRLEQDYKDSFRGMKESANSRTAMIKLGIVEDVLKTIPQEVSNKSVEIFEKYLRQFGITVKMINEIKEKLEIDELGFADILSKIAYVKDKKDLPPIAGKFIAYMMQHNPLISDIIRAYAEEDKKLKSKTSAVYYVAPGLGKTKLSKDNPNKFIDMDNLIAQAVKTITGKTFTTNEGSFLIGKNAEITEELKRLIEEVKNTHIILSPLSNSKMQLLGFNYSKYFIPASNNKNKILRGISERTGNPFEISEEDYNKMYVKPHETRKNTKVISSYISEEFKNLDRNSSNITEYLDRKEYSSSDNYQSLDKDEYFDRIGMMIANKLQEQVNLPVKNSIINKIVKLIKEFFNKLSNTRVNRIDQNIATIIDQIIQNNKDLITVNKYKPGAYGQEVSPVSIEKALESDVFGKEIVTRLSNLGFILAGSTALSEQGVILRPNENPLHDIDWVSVFNREETLTQFKKAYPESIFVRNINTKGSSYVTDSFLIVPDGYSISNYKVNMYGEKIIVASYDVVDSKNMIVGTYNLKTDPATNRTQEIETGIKGKIIDFFISTDISNNDIHTPYRHISKDGDLILLSHWKDIFKAKLTYARYKDIWDYNRFIPNDNLTSSKKYDSKESIDELDNSQSNYSPSLKMYEGFINLNQLYTGDEILPFIGESEYYRYLVPMLLKMNPNIGTVFTDDMSFVMENLMTPKIIEQLKSEGRTPNGISSPTLNRNFISNSTKTKTIIHELTHRTLQKEYEKNGEFRRKIDELYSYTSDYDSVDAYGFTNPKEFLAEALSNPDFMAILNTIQYKEETIWTYLMTLISDFMNNLLNIELRSDSVLAEVVRASEQILQNNLNEIGKNKPIRLSELGNEIVTNWNTYFPDYTWMNDAQKQMTAKLVEEGKIKLNCSL